VYLKNNKKPNCRYEKPTLRRLVHPQILFEEYRVVRGPIWYHGDEVWQSYLLVQTVFRQHIPFSHNAYVIDRQTTDRYNLIP